MAKVKKYKIKTKSSAKKRFKVTGTGKVVFGRAKRRHLNTKKSSKQMRHARRNGVLCDSDAKLVHRMLANC